jgi:hypothetical protein
MIGAIIGARLISLFERANVKKIFLILFLGIGINTLGMESNKEGNKESASDRIRKVYGPRYEEWLQGTRQAHSAERLSFFISCGLYQGLHKLLHEEAIKKSTEVLVDQVAINARIPIDSMSVAFENKVKLPLLEAERQLRLVNLKIQQLQVLRDEVALEMPKKSKL